MIHERPPQIKAEAGESALVERRRPGRREYLIPDLIRLLRRDGRLRETQPIETEVVDSDYDQLTPFTGVMVAVGLALPMWTAIAALLYFGLRPW